MYDTSGAIGVRDAVKPHRPPAAVSCRCSSPAILATRLPQRCASACIRQRDGRAHCMRIPPYCRRAGNGLQQPGRWRVLLHAERGGPGPTVLSRRSVGQTRSSALLRFHSSGQQIPETGWPRGSVPSLPVSAGQFWSRKSCPIAKALSTASWSPTEKFPQQFRAWQDKGEEAAWPDARAS
jgi:hypothetical protein